MLGTFDPASDFNCCGLLIVFSCHPCNGLRRLFDVSTAWKAVKMQHWWIEGEESPVLMQPWTLWWYLFSLNLKMCNCTTVKSDLIKGPKLIQKKKCSQWRFLFCDFKIHSMYCYLYRVVQSELFSVAWPLCVHRTLKERYYSCIYECKKDKKNRH